MSQGELFESSVASGEVSPRSRKAHVRDARVFRSPKEWELFPREDSLPEGHEARRLAEALQELDLSFLEGLYDVKGGVGYPPLNLLAAVLYGMERGVRSPTELQESCRYDARYRFLTRGHAPDDRTFARFLDRIEPHMDRLMKEVLGLCRKRGLARGNEVGLDGTRLAAACSQRRGKSSKEEPEARTMACPDGFLLGYNAQAVVDLEDGTILGAEVLSNENDFAAALPALGAMRLQHGRLPDTVVADSGYDAPFQIAALENLGVDTCVAPRAALPEYAGVDEAGSPVCRAGRALTLRHLAQKSPRVFYGEWGVAGCRSCPLKTACDLKGKRISVLQGQDPGPRLRNRERVRSQRHSGALRRRRRMEAVFGDLKRGSGFRRFTRVGRKKARCEFLLWACSHNLGKARRALLRLLFALLGALGRTRNVLSTG
jgi:transposase